MNCNANANFSIPNKPSFIIQIIQDCFEFGARDPKGLAAENSKMSCIIVIKDGWHNAAL